MGFDFLEALKGFAITVGFVAIHYFVIPWLIPVPFNLAIYFTIVLNASNFVAIITSWYYFNKSSCLSHEANWITMYGAKVFGSTITHFVLYIIRMTGSIAAAVGILLYPDTLAFELTNFFFVKIFLLAMSINTSVYLYEMINNVYAVSSGVQFKCNEISVMCKIHKDPIFCDG